MNKNLFFLIAVVVLFGSCTVQKRLHMDGYYVSWHGKGKQAIVHENAEPNQGVQSSDMIVQPGGDENLALSTPDTKPGVQPLDPAAPLNQAVLNEKPLENQAAVNDSKVSKKEQRLAMRELRKEAKEVWKELKASGVYSGSLITNAATTGGKSAPDTILLVLICILGFSPVAMYLYEDNKWTKRCTTNLILWLLCGLPGFIHALVVILGKK